MNEKETGNFIAEVRKQKNMTQRDLAEIVGVSDKTISKWETGKSLPDLSYLKSLCEALEITMNEMISCQRISESDYSQKAEENIMSLMKENENNKSKSIVTSVIGIVLIVLTVLLLLSCTQRGFEGLVIYPLYYFDVLSLLSIAFPAVGIVLVSRKKSYLEVLHLLDKILVPLGAASTLFSVILMMANLSSPETIGPNLAVCILSLLYAVIIKLIVVILIAWKE